jgi:hypothetical protein
MSDDELRYIVQTYTASGFVVASHDQTTVVLHRNKKFNVGLAIVGFLVCVIGLLVYAIVFACQKDESVIIHLAARRVSPNGLCWWDGYRWLPVTSASLPPGSPVSPDGQHWWDGSQWRPIPVTGPLVSAPAAAVRTGWPSPALAPPPGAHLRSQ